MDNNTYIDQVVTAWEGTYKKGLLTFWILVSLHNGEKHVGTVKEFIENNNTNITVDEKSLYRSLVRFKKMDLLLVRQQQSSSGGPALNIYSLSASGRIALKKFYVRNIGAYGRPQAFRQNRAGNRLRAQPAECRLRKERVEGSGNSADLWRYQRRRKASRSLLIVAASVVGMPCEKPG